MKWKSAEKEQDHDKQHEERQSKIVTNSTKNISADISMNGQKSEEVTSFKQSCAKMAPAQQKS